MDNLENRMCDFGCGQIALFELKNGKACCSKSNQSCLEVRRKNSEAKKGKCPKWKNGHPRYWLGKTAWNKGTTYEGLMGQKKAKKRKLAISKKLKGRIISQEQKTVLSQVAKARGLGGYTKGGGRGKHGRYKGIWCDSSWELAWVMFHLDNGILFERNKDRFEYQWEGEKHRYLPDFKMSDGSYVEIKAWLDDKGRIKLSACPGVKVLMKKEMEPFLRYAVEKYGKDFVGLYDHGRVL